MSAVVVTVQVELSVPELERTDELTTRTKPGHIG